LRESFGEIKEEEGPIAEVKIQVCEEAIIARVTRKAVSELKLSEEKKRLRARQSGIARPA
jgi:molybdopterin-binding protein